MYSTSCGRTFGFTDDLQHSLCYQRLATIRTAVESILRKFVANVKIGGLIRWYLSLTCTAEDHPLDGK